MQMPLGVWVWRAVCLASSAVLAGGIGYLLAERRRLRLVQKELMLQHQQRLAVARHLQDALLQSLHVVVLRFHYAAAEVRVDDPAKRVILAELQKADDLVAEARTDVEDLTASANAGLVLTRKDGNEA